jgi:hypothetical protein
MDVELWPETQLTTMLAVLGGAFVAVSSGQSLLNLSFGLLWVDLADDLLEEEGL